MNEKECLITCNQAYNDRGEMVAWDLKPLGSVIERTGNNVRQEAWKRG